MYKQVILPLSAVSALTACSGETVEPTPSGTPMQKEISLVCNVHGNVLVIYGRDKVNLKISGRTLELHREESPVAVKYAAGDDVLLEKQGNFLLELDGQEPDMCRLAEL